MKNQIQYCLFVAVILFSTFTTAVQAQNATTPPPRYKDVVVDNPNAEADMKVLADHTNAIVNGDLEKAKSLMSDKFMSYGPSPVDSSNAEKFITTWGKNYETQMNRKVTFITQTWKVLQGSYLGNWVSMWGNYTFTDKSTGKTVTFPFQLTSQIEGDKVKSTRIYFDNLYILSQLGFKVTPPEKK